MSTPVLAITGAVGVGKTTIAYEVSLLLREADVSHAVIDDEFALFFPRPRSDPDGESLRLAVLRTVWAQYAAAGVERLVLARAFENADAIDSLVHALPEANVQLFWLTADIETLHRRIEQKGVPSARDWCNRRATEQIMTWAAHPLPGSQVPTAGRDPREVAADLVARSGWLD